MAALCVTLLEGLSDPSFVSVRFSIEFLRPMPVCALGITTATLRRGRRLHALQATVFADDKLVARGSLVRLCASPLDLPAARVEPRSHLLPPDEFETFRIPDAWRQSGSFAGLGIEMKVDQDSQGRRQQPRTAWFRLMLPVLDGLEPSPMARAVAAADFANAIGVPIGYPEAARVRFPSVNLDVHVHRDMEGEWVAISASSVWTAQGLGSARADLSDLEGPFGLAAQSLPLEDAGQVAVYGNFSSR